MGRSRLSAWWADRCPSAADPAKEDAMHRQGNRHDPGSTHCGARLFRLPGGRPRRKRRNPHHVTMSREMCERLTAGKHTPERCLEAAFRFLLDREPKESILRRFDVTAVSRYFPEFEREMPRYFSQF